MSDQFSPFDHFKGNYKSKPADEPSVHDHALDYFFGIDPYLPIGTPNSPFDKTKLDPLKLIEAEKLKKKIELQVQKIKKLQEEMGKSTLLIEKPGFSCILNGISTCEHEPIDVGFTTPKMVCKKCDKDL